MRLELTGRHITITPAVRTLVEQRLQHILRLLNDSAVSAQVVLTKEKTRHHADVTLHARGEHFMHAAATGRDIATALGGTADKIDRQARRLKEKWKDRKRRSISAAKAASPADRGINAADGRRSAIDAELEAQQVRIIRARRYAVKPMSVDEAALEVGETADAFLVFRNATTDTINVLFRRPDGNLGLIEPEA